MFKNIDTSSGNNTSAVIDNLSKYDYDVMFK